MRILLKTLHIVALCVFVGSIPSHIVIGAVAERAGDAVAFAHYHDVKYLLTQVLTRAGLIAAVTTGVLVTLTRRAAWRQRWLQAKLILVLLIVLNGMAVLTPIAGEMAALAAAAAEQGPLDPRFAMLHQREGIAGAVNLLAIVAVIYLAVARPVLGGRAVAGHARA